MNLQSQFGPAARFIYWTLLVSGSMLDESDVPVEVVNRYTQPFVHWYWTVNSQAKYDQQ